MASFPPGPGQAPTTLDGPPPSPVNTPPPIVPRPPGEMAAAPPQAGASSKSLLVLGAEIDRALSFLSQSMPTKASGKMRQAKQLLQAALADTLVEEEGSGVAISPTAAGTQFPGGGLTPGKI